MMNKLIRCDKCLTEFESNWLNAKCPQCDNKNISKMTLIKYIHSEMPI